MEESLIQRLQKYRKDWIFIGLILFCILLALGGVLSDIEKRELLVQAGGARKIDLVVVKKQMSEGSLSPHKALFFRRLSP
jgi:hypothetical protein